MARAQLTVAQSTHDGVSISFTAANTTDGNYFLNSGRELLIVRNTGASPVDVTIDFVPDRYGRDGNKIHSVGANSYKVIGPFPRDLYNQPGEQVHINVSGPCDLAVVRG